MADSIGLDVYEQLQSLSPRERGEVLEEQDVVAVVRTAEYKGVNKNGTAGWEYQAELLESEWAGEQIVGKIWFSKKAADMFMQHITALGITEEFLATRPSPEQIADQIVNVTFKGKLEVNEWRGRKTNQIVAQEYLSGGPGDDSDGSGIEEFAATTLDDDTLADGDPPNPSGGAEAVDITEGTFELSEVWNDNTAAAK